MINHGSCNERSHEVQGARQKRRREKQTSIRGAVYHAEQGKCLMRRTGSELIPFISGSGLTAISCLTTFLLFLISEYRKGLFVSNNYMVYCMDFFFTTVLDYVY